MKFARAWLAVLGMLAGAPGHAAATYQDGYISNVTFTANTVLIMLSSGVPDNCTGAPYGWMMVPVDDKLMQGFVLGLWMRGDASQIVLRVFTSTYGGSGYCQINQIDPPG
jgi:hypothetical protein